MSHSSSTAEAKKRPRHFHSGPNPIEEEEEKQASSHVSPVARLYSHAIESVCSFLSLADLSRILAVSRSWSAAVRSMKSIGATVQQPNLHPAVLCNSQLSCHISEVGWYADDNSPIVLSCSDLMLIKTHLPNLTYLCGAISLPSPIPLVFSSKLETVKIRFSPCAEANAPSINAAIATVAQLPQLSMLVLTLDFFPALSFAPLQCAEKLRDLAFRRHEGMKLQLTPAQIDELRALPNLDSLHVQNLPSSSLVQLLRTPHSLQWKTFNESLVCDAPVSAALCSLPSLTKVNLDPCSNVDCLASLVHLRCLGIGVTPTISADAFVTAVSNCTGLESFHCTAAIQSVHLQTLLPHLPLLTELTLDSCKELESLRFLSACTYLHHSLEYFELLNCRRPDLHVTEMTHVHQLQALKSLIIESSFAEPMDPLSQQLHTPPSRFLPSLDEFIYEYE